MTRRRERLTVTLPRTGSVCFHRMPIIFLVHADGVTNLLWLTVPVVMPGVEIVNVPEAIAAKSERIQVLADAIFARVEGIAPEGTAAWIAIGHYHFGHGGAVDDGAQLALVLIADHVENKAFADMEAHTHLPLLPAHEIAFDSKAGPFRLANFERLDIGAQDILPQPLSFNRKRHGAKIVDPQ